jgi:hypothetical protein
VTPLCLDLLRDACAVPLADLTPRRAHRAAHALGSLARWWLRPEVLRAAADYGADLPDCLPPLPSAPGSCWVAFEQRDGLPLLRDALPLPLGWRGGAHGPGLPALLRAEADAVVRALRLGGWGLHLADDLAGCVLADDLPVTVASAWAPLAAGLLLAADGLGPRPGVWANGAWDSARGLRPIDGLEPKLALAAEWGAESFFVPVWQIDEAERALRDLGLERPRPAPLAAPAELSDARAAARLALAAYLDA